MKRQPSHADEFGNADSPDAISNAPPDAEIADAAIVREGRRPSLKDVLNATYDNMCTAINSCITEDIARDALMDPNKYDLVISDFGSKHPQYVLGSEPFFRSMIDRVKTDNQFLKQVIERYMPDDPRGFAAGAMPFVQDHDSYFQNVFERGRSVSLRATALERVTDQRFKNQQILKSIANRGLDEDAYSSFHAACAVIPLSEDKETLKRVVSRARQDLQEATSVMEAAQRRLSELDAQK